MSNKERENNIKKNLKELGIVDRVAITLLYLIPNRQNLYRLNTFKSITIDKDLKDKNIAFIVTEFSELAGEMKGSEMRVYSNTGKILGDNVIKIEKDNNLFQNVNYLNILGKVLKNNVK